MPVVKVYSSLAVMPEGLADEVSNAVSTLLGIRRQDVWMLWLPLDEHNIHRPGLEAVERARAPIVVMHCRTTYTRDQVTDVLELLRELLSSKTGCLPESVFVLVQRVHAGELLSHGQVWMD
jgi:phenylpyruvate tautomerase PptA (4-oxalocrotonate tautomerase family)